MAIPELKHVFINVSEATRRQELLSVLLAVPESDQWVDFLRDWHVFTVLQGGCVCQLFLVSHALCVSSISIPSLLN